VVSITLGRPVALRDEDIDTALPSPLDDDILDSRGGPASELGSVSQLSPFLHLIRLRGLSGRIKQALYSTGLSKSLSLDERLAARLKLRTDLETWKSDTAKLNLHQRPKESGPVSTFLSQVWYEVIYRNAMLLLYRPSPLLPHSGKRPTESEPPDMDAL
jgi:hypothetical protein